MGNQLKTIGVFLSSHEHVDAVYAEAVEAAGRWIGQHGLTLVYGGSRSGMMERLACAVRQSGGRVIGVVPDVVRQRGLESAQCDVIMYAAELADRKAIMIREADVLLALPGGIGTLDEMFTAAAADVIGIARKKVYALNVNRFWDPLWLVLEQMQRQGFLHASAMQWMVRVSSLEEFEQQVLNP